jgi:hypothetical protein
MFGASPAAASTTRSRFGSTRRCCCCSRCPGGPGGHRLIRAGALSDPQQGSIRLLMWLWLVVVVAFFSWPRSKLLGYVFPALPPLAWLLADGFLAAAPPSVGQQRAWSAASVAAVVVVAIAAVIALSVHAPTSTRLLAAALNAQRAPQEPVFMLGQCYFDLPFYARLHGPVAVIDDWASPQIDRSDNWRKELADAGRFAPAEASRVLLTAEGFAAALCTVPRAWVLAPTAAAATYAFLAQARAVAHAPRATQWVIEPAAPGAATALNCARTPNDG